MWSQSEILPEFLGISRILGHKLQGQDVSPLAWKASGLLIALLFAYAISVGFYRLYLSPLASIPGPKLAALTHWYEGYYEVWLGGKYFLRLEEMHKQYGPIVRINPIEVHYNDPECIDLVLAGPARKTNRHPSLARKTGTPSSMVTTVEYGIHRQRRNAVAGFFSTASIRQLEPIIQATMSRLLERLEETAQAGSPPVPVHYIFKACTSDVIKKYAFGESFAFMERADFGKSYFDATDMFFGLNHIMIFFPWFATLMQKTPGWFIKADKTSTSSSFEGSPEYHTSRKPREAVCEVND